MVIHRQLQQRFMQRAAAFVAILGGFRGLVIPEEMQRWCVVSRGSVVFLNVMGDLSREVYMRRLAVCRHPQGHEKASADKRYDPP